MSGLWLLSLFVLPCILNSFFADSRSLGGNSGVAALFGSIRFDTMINPMLLYQSTSTEEQIRRRLSVVQHQGDRKGREDEGGRGSEGEDWSFKRSPTDDRMKFVQQKEDRTEANNILIYKAPIRRLFGTPRI